MWRSRDNINSIRFISRRFVTHEVHDARETVCQIFALKKLDDKRAVRVVLRFMCHQAKKCLFMTRRVRYQEEETPLVVLAGKEYGTGSSRGLGSKRHPFTRCQSRDCGKL